MRRIPNHILLLLLLLAIISQANAAELSPTLMLARGERLTSSQNYKEAEKVFDSVLNIPGLRRNFEFQALDGRARCRKLLADYGKAADDYDRALSIPASLQNRAIVALNKSDLLITTGQYSEAEKLLKEVDTINDLSSAAKRRLFSNLASIKRYEQNFELSADIYRAILNLEATPKEKALTLQNLGMTLLDINDIENAITHLDDAYRIMSEEDKDGTTASIILSNLALANAIAGNRTDALSKINTALNQIERRLGQEHQDYLTALRKKGEILLMSSDRRGALDTFVPYFALMRSFITKTLPSMSEQARLDYWKKEKPLISELFALEDINPSFLADVALTRRAIALSGADKAFGMRTSDKLNISESHIRKVLKTNEVGVDFVIYPDITCPGKRIDKLGAIIIYPESSKKQSKFISYGLVSDFENHQLGSRKLITALHSTLDSDKNLIYSDTLLLAKIWNPIISNTPEGSTIHFAPDGFLNLLAIESLADIQSNPKTKSFKFKRRSSLATLLEREKNSSANKNAANSSNKNLLVAGGFNYDTLPELTNSAATHTPNHDAFNYLKSHLQGFGFKSLSGMKEEAYTISDIMSGSSVSDTLTEEDFKKIAPKTKRIHLATHGYTLDIKEPGTTYSSQDSIGADKSLLASGLALTGANIAASYPGREDGLISARELCDLDLSSVECVVLAACQTALGEITDEGPAGLLRGLKKAGVATVMATLWEVDDNATLLFMTNFYETMKSGSTLGNAYEKAKQKVREYKVTMPVITQRFDPATLCTVYEETGETEEVYPFAEPAYWAPFILVDSPE